MEYIINTFIEEVITELKNENSYAAYYEKKELDIPYLIAPLKQNLHKDEYKNFILDLSKYEYWVKYEEETPGEYSNGRVDIFLMDKTANTENTISLVSSTQNFHYSIEFTIDERHWGYCECTPEDDGYQVDKCCCGYGCDWNAPSFNIKKIEHIGNSSWNGNEHDYWEFEDAFYKSDDDLSEEKAEKDRTEKMKNLESELNRIQDEISKLKSV